MQTVLGVALACLASVLFNAAVVLQAREARAVPQEQGLHLSLLASLVQRRQGLVGIALQLLAFVLQTGALLLAPLTAVQPADAAGLLLLLYLGARHLGERVGRAEVLAVVAIAVGIAGLAIAAPKRQVTNVDAPDIVDVWLPLAGLAVAALAVTVVGEDWSSSPAGIGICLGLVTVGTVALGRTPTISELIASGHVDRPGDPPAVDEPGSGITATRGAGQRSAPRATGRAPDGGHPTMSPGRRRLAARLPHRA